MGSFIKEEPSARHDDAGDEISGPLGLCCSLPNPGGW